MKYTQILGYTFFRRRCAADREVCLFSIQLRGCNYHTSFALESVQVQESGAREASSVQNNTDAPCLTYQLCGYEGQKLYNTSVMPTASRGNGWMFAGDDRVYSSPVSLQTNTSCRLGSDQMWLQDILQCKKNNLPCSLQVPHFGLQQTSWLQDDIR